MPHSLRLSEGATLPLVTIQQPKAVLRQVLWPHVAVSCVDVCGCGGEQGGQTGGAGKAGVQAPSWPSHPAALIRMEEEAISQNAVRHYPQPSGIGGFHFIPAIS